jgi:polyphosphate glucokinase
VTIRLGIDVGGSGIKGALVDLDRGALVTERFRIPTPQPSTPTAVAEVVAQVAEQTGWDGNAFGCALPAVVTRGIVRTAANIDDGWIGTDGAGLICDLVGCPVTLLNDADAAGLAEMRYGVGVNVPGQVLMLTFGTGIGSALFEAGVLVENTELGHLEVDGDVGEDRAAARIYEDEDLTYEEWAVRVNRYLQAVETVLWPDLIIFGGGISKQFDEYSHMLAARARIVPAAMRNNAGIIGAALASQEAS